MDHAGGSQHTIPWGKTRENSDMASVMFLFFVYETFLS